MAIGHGKRVESGVAIMPIPPLAATMERAFEIAEDIQTGLTPLWSW